MELYKQGVYLVDGNIVKSGEGLPAPDEARESTIAYSIMRAHDTGDGGKRMRIKFDALTSHDITYVGVIQQSRFSGLTEFPVPYVLTNCHNSLCAVGGTINEDDHVFGLSAARKYGGIFVPANQSVMHMYMREEMSKCGSMILGSDSHTRYGALGTMGIGEGGPEIAKQLLSNTYDVDAPEVILVYLTGEIKNGVGPHDVAIALIGATFASGFANNKVLEFIGPGVDNLSVDFRCGVDVMTTETTCLSSIWQTDTKVEDYYKEHGRAADYKKLAPKGVAFYDSLIEIDLSKIEPMIAMPFHPSNAYSIRTLNENLTDILKSVEDESEKLFGEKLRLDLMSKVKDGKFYADQGIIAGCAGGIFENICDAAEILRDANTGDGYFSLSVYPGSMPVNLELSRNGVLSTLIEAGAVIKPAFCGPCFGAGDVPSNNAFSIRHTTRNFPNREGSKPGQRQLSSVALMDARSIAASARNKGAITPATECENAVSGEPYFYDASIYAKRVYNGFGKPMKDEALIMGPNITDWPKVYPLSKNLLVELTAVIHDPVTTTDELIPSGETSSYRSNPLKLAEFTLSRRCPDYVELSKQVANIEAQRREGKAPERIVKALTAVGKQSEIDDTQFGSCVFANRPGDGSAREQAASCQKVLGGFANICYSFATKRYRSNCINWGMLPFTIDESTKFDHEEGEFVFVPDIRAAIESGQEEIPATVVKKDGATLPITLFVKNLTDNEKQIILDGCLMNYYAAKLS